MRRYKRIADEPAANLSGAWKRYRCFADAAMPRDAKGYGTNYVNRTQRNAPLWIEVAHDSRNISFRVKTAQPIKGRDGEGDFMRILVAGKAVNGLGKMKVDGDEMTLEVPRAALGLTRRDFRFGFKFVDSTVACTDPLDWYELGVVEPLGRVSFTYCGK